jgi:hypothetical protein
MIADFPTAPIGSDAWGVQVEQSVAAQLAAQQAEWERQFRPAPPAAAAAGPQSDWILPALIVAVWFLAKK